MKYWVYIQGEVPGNYTPAELSRIKDFKQSSMVCPAQEGIADRNWQRAGQFPDIVAAIERAESETPPPSPAAPQPELCEAAEVLPKNPNEVLSDASTRIFTHVTGLMKELENRREERALTQSLQRQLAELKNELLALRERNQHLQGQSELIPGFEEREKRAQEKVARMQSEIIERDESIGGLEKQNEGLRGENERVKRAEDQLSSDLRRQTALGEELTKHLSDKEFTLAKAFGIIRKLEGMLGEILPEATAGMTTTLPGYADGPAPAPSPESTVSEDSAQEAEQTFPHPQPEPADLSQESEQAQPEAVPEAQPGTVPEDPPTAYTSDSDTPVPDETAELEGKPEEVPPPWQNALGKKIKGLFGQK